MTIATPFVNAGRRLIRSLRQTPGQDWLGPISSLGPVEMYRLLERFYGFNGASSVMTRKPKEPIISYSSEGKASMGPRL
jgi:hypothetical protein